MIYSQQASVFVARGIPPRGRNQTCERSPCGRSLLPPPNHCQSAPTTVASLERIKTRRQEQETRGPDSLHQQQARATRDQAA
ncbi:unnamed protein product, partial [Ectocarpus sp. 8 AP-2014]